MTVHMAQVFSFCQMHIQINVFLKTKKVNLAKEFPSLILVLFVLLSKARKIIASSFVFLTGF